MLMVNMESKYCQHKTTLATTLLKIVMMAFM